MPITPKPRRQPDQRTRLVLSALGGLLMATGAHAHADTQSVADGALVSPSEIVDCTLANGEGSQCARYVVKYLPDDLEIGPFCPATLDEEGGIWHWDGAEAGLYRIDGDFLRLLDEQGYTFFNEAGEVHSFDIRLEAPTETNECIQGSDDPQVEMTVLIPANPVMADEPTSLETVAQVGIGLDGVPIFGDAPSVLDTGHMPALDTCGGHVDPGGWYHWHATATDVNAIFEIEGVDAECVNVEQDQTAQFGYAFDGFAMFGPLNHDGSVPGDLDQCGGHIGLAEDGGDPVYHYHSGDTFPNLPACLMGVVAQDNFSTNAAGGLGSANGGGGPGAGPDFGAMAETLGVDPALLRQAMEEAGGRNADLRVVADRLGVAVEALQAALPGPGR
ncbi:YHYH protein [Profundibacterium mesophilum]|uniref:YHYH protein domain containing protein n=1 Tax=Profundibacterium mesophilum KAUST100406-0324 TaxID=1037889 RepID=A0A921NUX4_9RHOB|nr:YHYH protein [Profundibacterium mesophilum]KAF0675955.1 YHYH protein domain containing protein [Profundibacterium mesophilum KAUST100406-0324]